MLEILVEVLEYGLILYFLKDQERLCTTIYVVLFLFMLLVIFCTRGPKKILYIFVFLLLSGLVIPWYIGSFVFLGWICLTFLNACSMK